MLKLVSSDECSRELTLFNEINVETSEFFSVMNAQES